MYNIQPKIRYINVPYVIGEISFYPMLCDLFLATFSNHLSCTKKYVHNKTEAKENNWILH